MPAIPKKPDAILLDMDGTLFNTEIIFKDLWQKTATGFGLDLTDELYQKFIGARYDQCVGFIEELGGPGFDINTFLDAMTKDEQEIKSNPIPLKPGTLELFDWLEANKIPTGLVTSSNRETVQKHFLHYGGEDHFSVIVCGDDVNHPKPEPEPYLLACQRLGVNPENVVAVEDSNPGVVSALKAGCRTIMVPDVLPPDPQLKDSVEVILSSLEQLPGWIDKHD
ncbi:HAD family phosphatase [Sansalvadorimonas sp. 2012CJ34-2]|uniref:HAD family phosphatase n=1 Tax=Parendozoicomonas callyspongiae TaxID=2942213 RepID=A0ABT0PGB6_9GAMM|nr:HAD family phosphatase [Sansalvadorimonas sp. 2012CJ34-2]MCL6270306.1 HAD family phosphatase [Sansalvadorimonas sp. 2012CJ34-2]